MGSISQFTVTPSANAPILPPEGNCRVDDSQAVLKWADFLSSAGYNNLIIVLSKCGCKFVLLIFSLMYI